MSQVFRWWWKLSGKNEVLVGFEGNKDVPLIHIKTRKHDTGLQFSHTAEIDGAITLRQAKLLHKALTHVLKTIEPDRHDGGCPTFLEPRK